MKLKKAKTCVGCMAYDCTTLNGGCVLGFDTINLISPQTQIEGEKYHCGRTSTGEYWSFMCKPGEPCLKPTTTRQYTEAFNLIHSTNKEK